MREKLIELMFVGQVLADAECDKQAECNKCQYNAPNACRAGFIADHLIAHGVTVQEWIPVTERLPEESGLCLVYTARGMVMEMDYSAKYKQFNMYDDGIGTPIACTYWMPMPEPPKGE